MVNRKQGREGDNLETFRKRYAEFLELNPPLVHRYEQMGKLVTVRNKIRFSHESQSRVSN